MFSIGLMEIWTETEIHGIPIETLHKRNQVVIAVAEVDPLVAELAMVSQIS